MTPKVNELRQLTKNPLKTCTTDLYRVWKKAPDKSKIKIFKNGELISMEYWGTFARQYCPYIIFYKK